MKKKFTCSKGFYSKLLLKSKKKNGKLSWSYNDLKTFDISPSWQCGAILTDDGSGVSV